MRGWNSLDKLSRSKLITQPPVEFTFLAVNAMHVRAYCCVPIEVPVCFFTSSLDDMSMMCIIQDFMDLCFLWNPALLDGKFIQSVKNSTISIR